MENINFNGKNIVITGENKETTIIDGRRTGTVVTFVNNSSNLNYLGKFYYS